VGIGRTKAAVTTIIANKIMEVASKSVSTQTARLNVIASKDFCYPAIHLALILMSVIACMELVHKFAKTRLDPSCVLVLMGLKHHQ